jgi:branched-chain amino acid transport system permease protein
VNSPRFQVGSATRLSRGAWAAGAALLVALVLAPWWAEDSDLRSIAEFAYLVAIAQMWNLLAGYGGLISVGQHAFIGIGGYVLLILSLNAGISPFLCVPIAGVVSALVAIPVAGVVFRLRGPYFAIGTWAVADIFRLILDDIPAIGGGSGKSLTSALMAIPGWEREATTYWIALGLGFGLTLGVYLLLRSRLGLALTAIRDGVPASESLGVMVGRVKLLVFVASAGGLGLAGALIYLTKLRISPDSAFSVDWTVLMIFIVVIGGIGTIEGPIVGTAVFFLMRGLLADYGPWYLVVLGSVAILVMFKARGGLWGWVASRFDLHLFPTRRRIRIEGPQPITATTPAAQSPAAER